MIPGSIPLLKVGGIQISINYSWILIFLLVSANLSISWFPMMLPGRSVALYYSLGALSSVLLFVCVLAHELSHSLVAQRAGQRVRGIVLHVFGGVSLIHEEEYKPELEFRVAVAGPLLSIFLGIVFLVLRNLAFNEPHSIGNAVLTYLYFINFILAVFNLLPGFPLDGGRVLRSLLAFWKKDLVVATRIASRVGVIFAFILMGIGVATIIRGSFAGIWTILIGIFLKDAAEMSYRQVLMQDVFRQETVEEIMQKKPVIVPPYISIQQLIDDYFWHHHYGSFPVGADTALGIVTFSDVKKLTPEKRAEMSVQEIMHPISDQLRIRSGDSVLHAFEKATQNGVGRLLVVDSSDRLEGYLSLRDIGRAFQMRRQLT